MKFRTEIEPAVSSFGMNLHTGVVTVGSCFSEVLGRHLVTNKCRCLANPFGTCYNIVSIAGLIISSLEQTPPELSEVVAHQDFFYHHQYHSSFSANDPETLMTHLKAVSQETGDVLKQSEFLIITLGTSWVYRLKDTGNIVANCHKQPAALFDKILLDLSVQKEAFIRMREVLRNVNPGIRFILTVSPVRHLKDSLPLNAVSKSLLRVLCHELTSSYEDVSYFPAYEIMTDDLRDYRFYHSDMIHPNEVAEAYILEHFSECYFDRDLQKFIKDWSALRPALGHRPFHPEGQAHQVFLRNTLEKLKLLHKTTDMSQEIDRIERQILR